MRDMRNVAAKKTMPLRLDPGPGTRVSRSHSKKISVPVAAPGTGGEEVPR